MNNGLPGPNLTETITGGKTLELSKYDKIRKPHKAITDDTKIKTTARTLSTELCCPICLDLLTSTMTTKECLHRFCSECITTAITRGNKECPTCRKKIVSKRSLRPDPNFDFLINQIYDRKKYEAELNTSMQLFQEQSNVASLQRSIEEGIKAQAAYRKQRVQGSYDIKQRKRRPKLPPESSNGQSVEEGEMGGIEQVTVTLTPAHVDLGESSSIHIGSPMDSSISNESEHSVGDSSDSDSSSVSSDSTLCSSSSSISTLTSSPQRTTIVAQERTGTVSPAEETENQARIEQIADEMGRRAEEIEVELVPTKSMMLAANSVPSQLCTSHFVRARADTPLEAIAKFLAQLVTSVSDSHEVIQQNMPENFFVVDRSHQLRKLNLRESLASAFLWSIQWGQHLMLFFELDSFSRDGGIRRLNDVVGDELVRKIRRIKIAEQKDNDGRRKAELEKVGWPGTAAHPKERPAESKSSKSNIADENCIEGSGQEKVREPKMEGED